MTRSRITAILCAIASVCVLDVAPGQDSSASRTGNTNPDAVIAARRALMSEMERLIAPIDLFAIGEPAEPDELRSAAETIAAMLTAFPHLFPPPTNLYDDQADIPVTLALPAVWDDFATFSALSEAASESANALSFADSEADLRSGSSALRGTCDGCHAVFLLPYTPSTATSEDLDFDFDALFENVEDE